MAERKVCQIDGCGKPTCAHGLCRTHYGRLRSTGDPNCVRTRHGTGKRQKWVERVCLPYEGDGCLIWPFSRNPNGYAYWNVGGRATTAARVICGKIHGPPPEPWYEAAHSCGRGHDACVNPKHLRWATPADNRADKRLHGTHLAGADHRQAKFTVEQVVEIRAMAGQRTQSSIAREFGVSHSLISQIINGLSYA